MARQRRTLAEQLAELSTGGRNERTHTMSTPALDPIGSDMIEENAISEEHIAPGSVRLDALAAEVNAVLTDLDSELTDNRTAQDQLAVDMDELRNIKLPQLGLDLTAAEERIAESVKNRVDPLDAGMLLLEQSQATISGEIVALKETTLPALRVDLASAQGRLDAADVLLNDSFPKRIAAAEGSASTAASRAETAVTAAGSAARVLYSTGNPSGTAREGDTWRKTNGAAGDIIAEWRYTKVGTAAASWKPQAITTEMISNLDVGKLSAGTAAIDTLVAQKVALATATIQKADIGNLTVTGESKMNTLVAEKVGAAVGEFVHIDIGTGTFGEMDGGRIKAGTVQAQHMLVGSFGNLIPNGAGEWGKAGAWAENFTWDTDAPAGLPGSFKSPKAVTVSTVLFPAEPGTQYRFEMWIKADKPNSKFYIEMRDQAGGHAATWENVTGKTGGASGGYPVGNYTVPTTWTKLTAEGTTTAAVSKLRLGQLYINHTAGTETAATVSVAGIKLVPLNDGELIVNGSIKGNAVDAKSVAAEVGTFVKADIGNLTVTGTSSLNDVVAKQIGADVGTYVKLSTDNLVAGKAQMATGVADKLYGDVIAGRKFYANQIYVGEGGNLLTTDLTDPAWSAGANLTYSATDGYSGGPSLLIGATSTQFGSYFSLDDSAKMPKLVAGQEYRVTAKFRSAGSVPTGGVSVYFRLYDEPGGSTAYAWADPSNVSNKTVVAANTWGDIEGYFTVPAGSTKTRLAIGLYSQAKHTSNVRFSDVVVQTAITPELLVDGVVTSRALETELVLASKIIAGDKTGVRAEMSPDGFKVFTKSADGVASETVRMGVSSTDDMFAITDASGAVKASIDQQGRISAPIINADDELWYKGEKLEDTLSDLPKGIIAMANRDTNSPVYDSASERPYMHLTFNVEDGRLYKISTNGLAVDGDGSALIVMRWAQNTRATTSSIVLAKHYTAPSSMGSAWQSAVVFNRGFRCWWTGTLSILISLRGIGTSRIKMLGNTADYLNFIMVEDIGKLPSNTGESLDGPPAASTAPAPTPPPIKQNFEKTWTASSRRSYLPSGAIYNFSTSKMFQGLSPAGQGNLTSAAVWPDLTASLSGATINWIKVYLYAEHFYYNSGGTVRIGLIGKALPATQKPSTGIVATSTGWPKPGGRWVTIPAAYHAGFKAGTWGGISLNGDSTYNTYGYFSGTPQIKINYTK